MKSRIAPIEMTVSDLFLYQPHIYSLFRFILDDMKSSDIVRISTEGKRYIIDFIGFSDDIRGVS